MSALVFIGFVVIYIIVISHKYIYIYASVYSTLALTNIFNLISYESIFLTTNQTNCFKREKIPM